MVTTEVEMTSLVVILLFHMGLKDLVQNVNNCNSITCTNANDSLCNIGKNQNKMCTECTKAKGCNISPEKSLISTCTSNDNSKCQTGDCVPVLYTENPVGVCTAVDFTLPSLSKYFIQSIKNKKNLASSIGLTSVCIDNKDVRNKIMKSKNISIITVTYYIINIS